MKLRYNAKAHAYYLDGKRLKSPSAIAKVPDDTYHLNRWRNHSLAKGLALEPTLLVSIGAAGDDKDRLDEVVEQAITKAGGTRGREYGNAAHAIIDADHGGKDLLETPEVKRIREQWRALRDAHGLTVVRSEFAVVNPELGYAGRCDMAATIDGHPLIVTGDIKTGAQADQYLHAHCVQLWLYASAPFLAKGIPTGDVNFETEDFEAHTGIDTEVGFVVHLPMEGEPKLIPVDLRAGRECFERVIRPTWDWRARKDLVVALPARSPRPVGDTSRADASPPAPATASTVGHATEGGAAGDPEVAAWLVRRIGVLADRPAVAAVLMARWPADVPTFRQVREGEAPAHTAEQLAVIERLVNTVGAEAGEPFTDTKPMPPLPPLRLASVPATPARPAIDEGRHIDETDERFVALVRQLEALPSEDQVLLDRIAQQASEAGTPVSLRQLRSERRFAIVCALWRCALAGALDDGSLRDLLHGATGHDDVLQPGIPVGAAVGLLTIAQADRLAALADAIGGDGLRLTFSDEGRPVFSGPAWDALPAA